MLNFVVKISARNNVSEMIRSKIKLPESQCNRNFCYSKTNMNKPLSDYLFGFEAYLLTKSLVVLGFALHVVSG